MKPGSVADRSSDDIGECHEGCRSLLAVLLADRALGLL
jgi:hypothetical protein